MIKSNSGPPRSITTVQDPNGCKVCHSLCIDLLVKRLPRLRHLAKQLEVVDIVSGREGVEELALVAEGVGEGMRRAHGYSNIIAYVAVDDAFIFDVKAQPARKDQEGLVMLQNTIYLSKLTNWIQAEIRCPAYHFVPMHWRSVCVGRDGELGGAKSVVCE